MAQASPYDHMSDNAFCSLSMNDVDLSAPTVADVHDLTDMFKAMSPYAAAETVVAVQVERMRTAEALAARDVVVHHLSLACKSIQDKSAIIDRLLRQKKELEDQIEGRGALIATSFQSNGEQSQAKRDVAGLEEEITRLQREIKLLRGTTGEDDPPTYEEGSLQMPPTSRERTPDNLAQFARQDALRVLREATFNNPSRVPSPLLSPGMIPNSPKILVQEHSDLDTMVDNSSIDPEESIKARHAILAALPLPTGVPSDALKPIVIPAPYTLQEFLSSAAGPLRTSLSNYRIFQQLTTNWCPEREEHGYFLTPLFKCNTNPRVATAHRWMMVDVIGKMDRPTECFYNKDGKWYYAGVYKAIRLADLTTREWEQLSPETTQALVKDTIAGRKNTSPQTIYEMTQLYGAGALKVACIGLQCIGFNNALYRAVLEQAGKCAQSGRWRSPFSVGTNVNWSATAAATSPHSYGLSGAGTDGLSAGENAGFAGDACSTG